MILPLFGLGFHQYFYFPEPVMGTSVQDGGYAWVVCGASCLILVIQGGLVYSMGVLYIMFQDALDAADTTLSLITSLNICIIYIVSMSIL